MSTIQRRTTKSVLLARQLVEEWLGGRECWMLADSSDRTAADECETWAAEQGILDECVVYWDIVDAICAARLRYESGWRDELADALEEQMAYAGAPPARSSDGAGLFRRRRHIKQR